MMNLAKGQVGQGLLAKTVKLKIPEKVIYGKGMEYDIHSLTFKGKLTEIVDFINSLEEREIDLEMNKKDKEGKIALHYAAYLGFKNILLYLLSYGCNPTTVDNQGQCIYHILAYRGELQAMQTLLNYERFLKMRALHAHLYAEKHRSGFKNVDVDHGILIATYLQEESTKLKFAHFLLALESMFRAYCKDIVEQYSTVFIMQDKSGRNPLHHVAENKYSGSYNTLSTMMNINFGIQEGNLSFLRLFDELQTLEFKEDRKTDPRKYIHVIEEFTHLLDVDVFKNIEKEFHRDVARMLKRAINMPDTDGFTPLHVASQVGNYLATEHFLKLGGDATMKDYLHNSLPLDIAKNGLVRKVLTNLNQAAYNCDDANLKYLVNCGNKIDKKWSIFGEAPIHQTIKSSKGENIRTLQTVLDCGADINLIDVNGWTALHYAAKKGDCNLARILLENGAVIDAFSNSRKTPLHLAALGGHPDMIRLLHSKSASMEFQDDQNCTPLHLACKKGHNQSVKVLLTLGAKLCVQDKRLWTPLHYAAYNGNKNVAYLLLYHDVDTDKLRKMKNSQFKTAEEIISDPSTKHAFTNIWKASREGNLDIIRILHRKGQDINEQTQKRKNTPLHVAVLGGQLLVVKYLIENKANATLRNINDKLPIDLAAEKKQMKIYDILAKKAPPTATT